MKMLKNQRFQKFFIFLAGIFSLGLFSSFVSAQISIPLSFDNAIEYIKRIIITDSGGNSGNVLLDVDGSNKTIRINTGYIANGSGWNNKALGLSGDGQLIYIDQAESNNNDYFPLSGNSTDNPITGDFYIKNGSGSYKLGIETITMNLGTPTPIVAPVITPLGYVPGKGLLPLTIHKGMQFFMGETGETSQINISDADGTFNTVLLQNYNEALFVIAINSGSLMNNASAFMFWGDGRLQARDDISSIIYDDRDFITKKYIDDRLSSIPGAVESYPVGNSISGNYFPLAGNSIANPITGALFMGDGNSNLTISIETGTTMVGNTTLLYTGPVITPMTELQGGGLFPMIGIKGMPMLQGLPGQTTSMYFTNSTGDRGAGFELDELGNRFDIYLSSGGLDQQITKWSFGEDGRIQAGEDISSVIVDDKDFITKKYLDYNFYPLAGNSITNPITGPLFMGDSTGSYNVEIGTTMLNFGAMTPVYGPIITPNAFLPGLGPISAMVTKGINFFLGEDNGDDTHMFLSNFDGTFATKFSSHGDEPAFEIGLYSGDLTDDIVKWRFNDDGRIQVNNDISSFINDDIDFITKKYADQNFFPGTSTNPMGNGVDFRFAWSGGLMEAQYFVDGAWTTATIFTLP